MSIQQGSHNLNPGKGGGPERHRRSDRNRRGRGGFFAGARSAAASVGSAVGKGAKTAFSGLGRFAASVGGAVRKGAKAAFGGLKGHAAPARGGAARTKAPSGGISGRAASPKTKFHFPRGAKGFFSRLGRGVRSAFSAAGRAFKRVFGGMSVRGRILIGVLGLLLVWAVFSLVTRWIIPNAKEKQALDSVRSLVGATADPASVTEIPLPADTPAPTPEEIAADALTPAPPAETATAVPAYAPNTTARISGNGLFYAPELLEEYIALYSVNRDMGGWIRVRAIKNIDFPYVRGKNEYYITHDFYGGVNSNGTAFLDETCKDWPRDQNLLIYAHNLKSGEMFGELNRLSNYRTLRANPFADCDTLYEKGVYIPVAVLVCSVDPKESDYFDFHTGTFRNQEAFDRYITRARELNLVNLQVDVNYSDELLTLVTCYDEAGLRRFLAVYRRLRADETEASVLEKYFR